MLPPQHLISYTFKGVYSCKNTPLFSTTVHSSRAESKCSQRQQKALSSTVHRLSEKLKQLQQENTALREELNTDSPAGGLKGTFSQNKNTLALLSLKFSIFIF